MTITDHLDQGLRPISEPHAPNAEHRPIGVYEPCHCDPSEPDYEATHFTAAKVGMTCFRGLLFYICSDCCTDPRLCSLVHDHGIARPACTKTKDQVAHAEVTS